ncbi:MAG: tetratricopeptide repeat protein [Thermoguttaceae bacterium]|nr:tetratricopeptide repeat protein [Thermoguttaceae bacterium]MDW8038561.1 tetratricopeptide repeat protein [Thermoguttaceae bacterium]
MWILVVCWGGLLWAAESPPKKTSPKDPQNTGPGHIDFIKTTSSNQASKDSAESQQRSDSSRERTGRPYRYYYYYYGPYWPGYPWPYPPPPPPPVYIPYGPIFVDPDVAGYGPRSILRLMGVEHWFSAPPSTQQSNTQRSPAINRAGNVGAGVIGEPQQAPKAPNQPNLNPPLILEGPAKGPPGQDQGRAGDQNAAEPAGRNPERAMLLVDLGDAHFANKKYAEALQRYREAARLDPQLPEAHLHMGFALLGMGKYAEAAQAFKRGLELHPNWPASGFRLQVLYGPQEAERVAHRNALAGAVAAKPNDPDLLFLLGVLFYFDQMREQARRCFQEAARLAAPNATHIDLFLRRL